MNAPFVVFHSDKPGLQPLVDLAVVVAIAPFVYEIIPGEAVVHHFFCPVDKRHSLRGGWHSVLAQPVAVNVELKAGEPFGNGF